MTEERRDAVRLTDVTIQAGETTILESVSAHIPLGESTAIVGPNGAGKTSLTLALLGQMPYTGTIEFFHRDGASMLRPRFGFVPQKLQFDRDMPMTVMDFLLCGMQRFPLFFGASRKTRGRILAMLEEVDCSHLAKRSFGALSGGEMQRILLAQALLQEPEILVLDEPTAGVDFKGGQLCCELLKRIRGKLHFTQLMISHDLATVSAHASHVICLNHRLVAEGAPRVVLTHKVLTETFGLHLGIVNPQNLAANATVCDANCPCGEYHHCHEAGSGCCSAQHSAGPEANTGDHHHDS